jgi:hypothetical protein
MKKASSARETALIQQTSSVIRVPAMRIIGIHAGFANASTAARTTVGIPPQSQVVRLRIRRRK